MSDSPAMTRTTGTFPVKTGLAEMMKGGVIMDVVTPGQATTQGTRTPPS